MGDYLFGIRVALSLDSPLFFPQRLYQVSLDKISSTLFLLSIPEFRNRVPKIFSVRDFFGLCL